MQSRPCKVKLPCVFCFEKGYFYELFESSFQKREKWIEFDTLYSIERLEQLRFFMVENHIPYKVRAVLLPVPLNAPMPSCAASRSLWYVSVHPEDVHRVEYYLRTERSC